MSFADPMSYGEERLAIATKILSGFASNPAIFAANADCGWRLVNATDSEIAAYSIKLAEELLHAAYHIPERKYKPADHGKGGGT